MPIVPQITNPFQGKGYHSSLNNQTRPGGEQFEIIQLTKTQVPPGQVAREGDRQAGRQLPNRTDLPQLLVKTAKDPSMAVETLKQLISSELLATASANGYTELHGELENLSKSIYVAVDNLVAEMLNQEKQTTMFSGNQLFDLLRGLANHAHQTQNPDMSVAIANFLKAVNFSFNRDEILNALSANLRFLSTYFQPSPQLSDKLGQLADAWAGIQSRENFELLKGETIKLLYNVSESLLNNEKTQVLIPLIIHNLSRYNTNDFMLKEAFNNMMMHVPHAQKGSFMVAFEEFLDSLIYGALKGKEAPEEAPKNQAQQATQEQVNNTTETEKNQAPVLDKSSFPFLYGEKLAEGRAFPPAGMTQDALAGGLREFLLDKSTGLQAMATILANLIEGAQDANLMTALQSDLAKMDSITSLVNYLNSLLTQLPDVPERQLLFQMLSETISGMAEKGELPANTPQQEQAQQALPDELTKQAPMPEKAPTPQPAASSALEELTAFIEKNINHNALKTLDSYNASNLLQSLINAPGVYTPLSHFIIPLEIGDMRAFGELWVDNEESGGNSGSESGERNYHLFLTFEIESVGRFETDLYAHGTEVSLALLHPESFSLEMVALKEKISKIIASTDYTVKEFQTGVLKEPHDLTQIFPRIVEKRTGLDVSV
jgi:hypothetical protein